MQFELKVNGKVVAVFMSYQNTLAVLFDLFKNTVARIEINNTVVSFYSVYQYFDESKTTFNQFNELGA